MSALTCADLTVRFGDRTVLDGVSVYFVAGGVTAIIGANGAGKSTLLGGLAGLIAPNRGHVALGGQALATFAAADRARRIAYLPQTPEVAWAIDVRTLVGLGRTPHRAAFGATAEDDRAVDRALDLTETAALAGRDVTTLSGGERARVLIARALAGEPEWLLADEPLTGLDPGYQLDVVALLRRMADEGRGIVVTLHDLTLAARLADRIVVLRQGKPLAAGDAATVLTPKNLSAAYGIDAAVHTRDGRFSIDVIGRRL
jgi:iron complex transport system ATP-binding protein